MYARILIPFGEDVVRCCFVSSTINCLSCFCLNWFIFYLFQIKEKRHCLSKWSEVLHYLWENTKAQPFLIKLAVFLLLSGRYTGTNSLPEAYSLPKGSPPLWGSSWSFIWAHSPSQNNRKIHENLSNKMFKMCGRELSDTSLADFI
jgi:hypothetical protein